MLKKFIFIGCFVHLFIFHFCIVSQIYAETESLEQAINNDKLIVKPQTKIEKSGELIAKLQTKIEKMEKDVIFLKLENELVNKKNDLYSDVVKNNLSLSETIKNDVVSTLNIFFFIILLLGSLFVYMSWKKYENLEKETAKIRSEYTELKNKTENKIENIAKKSQEEINISISTANGLLGLIHFYSGGNIQAAIDQTVKALNILNKIEETKRPVEAVATIKSNLGYYYAERFKQDNKGISSKNAKDAKEYAIISLKEGEDNNNVELIDNYINIMLTFDPTLKEKNN